MTRLIVFILSSVVLLLLYETLLFSVWEHLPRGSWSGSTAFDVTHKIIPMLIALLWSWPIGIWKKNQPAGIKIVSVLWCLALIPTWWIVAVMLACGAFGACI